MAVDRFPLARGVDPSFYRALANRLNVGVEATLSRIRYIMGTSPTNFGPHDCFDVFVSNATLEHLADVRGAGARQVH